jgi:hypothetical protein
MEVKSICIKDLIFCNDDYSLNYYGILFITIETKSCNSSSISVIYIYSKIFKTLYKVIYV